MEAQGKNSILIQTKRGIKLITDVLFITGLEQNLLSVVQMQNKGYSILFKNDYCLICDHTNILVTNIKKNENNYVFGLTMCLV